MFSQMGDDHASRARVRDENLIYFCSSHNSRSNNGFEVRIKRNQIFISDDIMYFRTINPSLS